MINVEIMNQKQLRDYGFIMGIAVAGIFGLYPWIFLKKVFVVWPWYVLGGFWLMSIIYPKLLAPIYAVWMKVGHILGKINSTIILSLCYFVLFVPLAVIFRLMKRDRLHRWNLKSQQSYRKSRAGVSDSKQMEQPF